MTFHKRLFKEKDTTPVYCEKPVLAITIPVWYDEDRNRETGSFVSGAEGCAGPTAFCSP